MTRLISTAQMLMLLLVFLTVHLPIHPLTSYVARIDSFRNRSISPFANHLLSIYPFINHLYQSSINPFTNRQFTNHIIFISLSIHQSFHQSIHSTIIYPSIRQLSILLSIHPQSDLSARSPVIFGSIHPFTNRSMRPLTN